MKKYLLSILALLAFAPSAFAFTISETGDIEGFTEGPGHYLYAYSPATTGVWTNGSTAYTDNSQAFNVLTGNVYAEVLAVINPFTRSYPITVVELTNDACWQSDEPETLANCLAMPNVLGSVIWNGPSSGDHFNMFPEEISGLPSQTGAAVLTTISPAIPLVGVCIALPLAFWFIMKLAELFPRGKIERIKVKK